MNLTIEQQNIINAVQQGSNIQVQALAGTGKSTTLREIATALPTKKFLVLCFNAANALESNNHPSKPSNVTYSTVHSMAYHEIVIKNKLKSKLQNYLDYNDIVGLEQLAKLVAAPRAEKTELSMLRKVVTLCIQEFCKSDSNSLQTIAENVINDYFTLNFEKYSCILPQLITITCEYGTRLFNSNCKINHDVYVKMYQLNNVQIRNADVVMLDEAQDSNAVTLAIIKQQTSLQKVVVGDDNQLLYAWRGATGVNDKFNDYVQLELTNSFRFGKTIASMANVVLVGKTDLRVVGLGTNQTIKTKVHLCRTNASVVAAATQYMANNTRIFINIDINDLFSKLWHMQACYFNNVPKYPNKELVNITNKESLLELMQINNDIKQLSSLQLTLCNTYGNLTEAKKKFASLCASADEAEVSISTIHRSKGLEWDSVVVDDDFISFKDDDECESNPIADMWEDAEKTNLLYVAITRAKVICELPEYLQSYFK